MAGKALKNLAARELVSLYGKTIVISDDNQQRLSFINESHTLLN
jgi:DNA-directed RNA polymerase subunit L